MEDIIKTYKNPQTNNWFVDLEQDRNMRKYVPATLFYLTNNSDLVANIYLNGTYMGEAQPYSPFSVTGKGYETFTINNADGQQFNANELIVQVSKTTSISQLPYNPQVDLLEDNLDRYASGCDNRISFGGGITADHIKYWINNQNALIVQRRLELSGTGSMGTYDISFGSGDDLSGGVGTYSINTIEKRIKKTIINHGFGYTTSNCNISGWILDYIEANDWLDNKTQISNTMDNPSRMFDNDMTTYSNEFIDSNNWYTVYQCSFPSVDVKGFSAYTQIHTDISAGQTARLYLELYNGSWHTAISHTTSSTSWQTKHTHNDTSYNNTTQMRIRMHPGAYARDIFARIQDITLKY